MNTCNQLARHGLGCFIMVLGAAQGTIAAETTHKPAPGAKPPAAAPPAKSAKPASPAAKQQPPSPSVDASRGSAKLVREGSSLTNQVGHFKIMADNVEFVVPADGRRFRCLENLNLDRVTRMLVDNSDSLQWSVTGTVTEYQGNNFLLISRALLKAKASEAAPSKLSKSAAPAKTPAAHLPRTAAN